MRIAQEDGVPAAPAGIALLMILGLYLLDGPAAVWQETLVSSLERLGYSEHAARQAIARATRRGLLVAERDGRRARMSLTPAAVALLREGEQRLFSLGAPWSWDGEWLVLNVRVPEAERHARHRLRKQLAWAGLGSLGNGVWLTPHLDREGEVAALLAREPAAEAWTFRARHGRLGELDGLVRQAWDVDAMIAAYEGFLADFRSLRPRSDDGRFVALTSMLTRWRTFPFLDPDLPAAVLPRARVRDRAYRLFHDRLDRWLQPARRFMAARERL